MKFILLQIFPAILFLFIHHFVFAQGYELVVDYKHTTAVVENGVVQSAAESTHHNYLDKIKSNLETINANTSSVVLAQTMIYQSLANVNSALKNGLVVKDLATLVADILQYSGQAITMAKTQPWLLLFAGDYAVQIKVRALRLVSEVSAFVLKQGGNVLADYNGRDQLLNHVRQELQVIDGMAYGAWKAMYWAKEKGILASLNPYNGFVNTDRAMAADIIRNTKYLHQ